MEHVPATGAVILVANHGGVLPIDAAMMCLDVLRRMDPPRIPRAIADHFVPRLPFVSTLFARLGVVSGPRANVLSLEDAVAAIEAAGRSTPSSVFNIPVQWPRAWWRLLLERLADLRSEAARSDRGLPRRSA